MRILETALAISCLPILAAGLLGCRMFRFFDIALLMAPAAVLIAQAALEGFRPPLAPLYLVAAILGLLGLASLFLPHVQFPSWLLRGGSLGGLALVAAGIFLARDFPVFRLPKPPGPYPIGVATLQIPSPQPGRPGVTARIWYPAKENTGEGRAPYLPPSDALAAEIPPHVQKARIRARENAEPAGTPARFPVILYSPPWTGGSFQNTALFEALASEGFVVAAVELPGGASRLPPPAFSSDEAVQQFQKAAAEQLELRAFDLLSAFAALSGLDSGALNDGRFKGRLDLHAVGVIGYSFGGAVAAEALTREPRLRSGVNLDGVLFGNAAQKGARQPFLFITDAMPVPTESELRSPDGATRRSAEFYAKGFTDLRRWLDTHGGWWVQFHGANHASFYDASLYAISAQEKARQTLEKVDLLVVAFFDKTLRDRTGTLMDRESLPWPEAKMRRYHVPKTP